VTDPSRTLREIAALADDPAVRSKIEQAATELELQHNAQNNQFQAALSNAELGIDNTLDKLRADITKRFGDVDARQHQMLQMLGDLQDSLRALQTRPPCMHPNLARDQLEAGADDTDRA
jgi:hypothetical protein